jgi:hypothetical protein
MKKQHGIFLFLIFSYTYISASEEREIFDIKIERNYLNNSSTLFLFQDSLKIDSLQFFNLNLEGDSFVNYNNKWWYYMYTDCNICAPTVEEKSQLILVPKNKKLHIAFVTRYRYTNRRLEAFETQKGDSLAEIKKHYRSFGQLTLDSNFFNNTYNAELIFYGHMSFKREEDRGIRRRYSFKYDEKKKVFYTKKKIMNGIYKFNSGIKTKEFKKRLNNEEVIFLEYYGECKAYYKGNWYTYLDKFFMKWDPYSTLCPLGCTN